MLQLGLAFALIKKPLLKVLIPGKFRQEKFYGGAAAQLVMAGFPHVRHTPFPDLTDQGVLTDFILWVQGLSATA